MALNNQNRTDNSNELLLMELTQRYPKKRKKMIKELRRHSGLTLTEATTVINVYLKNGTNLLNCPRDVLQNTIAKNKSTDSIKAFGFFIGFLFLIILVCDSNNEQSTQLQHDTDYSINETVQSSAEPESNLLAVEIPDKYIDDLTVAMKQINMDINNISNVEKLEDWNNGERYKIYYDSGAMNEYNIYFYDTGKVASINNTMNEKLYEYQVQSDYVIDDETIKLVFDQLGDYGQEDDFSGYKTIRYYLPAGKYSVTCETRGSGFYIESIEKHLENGYETSDIIQHIKFSDTIEEFSIEIKEGQCISLLLNSILHFKPIK